MSGVVSFSPAASTTSRLIHVAYGSPVIALTIRPSRPKPWLEVFHARAGRDDERQLELGTQLGFVEVRPPVEELAGILAVTDDAGGMREKLRDGRAGDIRVQAFDVVSRRIVEFELALLTQLHDAGRREALRV
jgi:hypothetical protein